MGVVLLFALLLITTTRVEADIAPDPFYSIGHPDYALPFIGLFLAAAALSLGLWFMKRKQKLNADSSERVKD